MADIDMSKTVEKNMVEDDVLRYEMLESNGPKGAPQGAPVMSVRNLPQKCNGVLRNTKHKNPLRQFHHTNRAVRSQRQMR